MILTEMRTKLALSLALLALCLAAIVSATARHTSATTNCDADGSLDSEELAFLRLINNYREQNGLVLLSPSDTLNRSAAWKSQDMAANGYVAHDDTPIGRTWMQRIRDCGYSGAVVGENITVGNESASDAFSFWQNLPDHNAIMLGANYVAIGIGRVYQADSLYGWYWTTEFGSVSDGYSSATPTPAQTDTPPPPLTGTPSPLLTGTPTPALTGTPPPPLLGDANCNGAVDSIDAALVLQYGAGLVASLPCLQNADVNHDSSINAIDAALLLQFGAGLLPHL